MAKLKKTETETVKFSVPAKRPVEFRFTVPGGVALTQRVQLAGLDAAGATIVSWTSDDLGSGQTTDYKSFIVPAADVQYTMTVSAQSLIGNGSWVQNKTTTEHYTILPEAGSIWFDDAGKEVGGPDKNYRDLQVEWQFGSKIG